MGRRRAGGDYEIDLHLDELSHECSVPVLSTPGVSSFDDDVLTFDEAVVAQSLEEGL